MHIKFCNYHIYNLIKYINIFLEFTGFNFTDINIMYKHVRR